MNEGKNDQGLDTDEEGADSDDGAPVSDGGTGTVTQDSQPEPREAQLAKELKQYQSRWANATRKITKTSQELADKDREVESLRQRIAAAEARLDQQQNQQNYYGNADASEDSNSAVTSRQLELQRQAILELHAAMQEEKNANIRDRTTQTERREVMRKHGVSEEDADTYLRGVAANEHLDATDFLIKAREIARLRATEKAAKSARQQPYVTGGGGSVVASSGEPLVKDMMDGKYTANQLAAMFADKPELLDQIAKQKKKSPR